MFFNILLKKETLNTLNNKSLHATENFKHCVEKAKKPPTCDKTI